MRLFPIRFGLLLGEFRIIEATLFDRDKDEPSESVNNSTPFGFQLASDELVDEVQPHLDPDEG